MPYAKNLEHEQALRVAERWRDVAQPLADESGDPRGWPSRAEAGSFHSDALTLSRFAIRHLPQLDTKPVANLARLVNTITEAGTGDPSEIGRVAYEAMFVWHAVQDYIIESFVTVKPAAEPDAPVEAVAEPEAEPPSTADWSRWFDSWVDFAESYGEPDLSKPSRKFKPRFPGGALKPAPKGNGFRVDLARCTHPLTDDQKQKLRAR